MNEGDAIATLHSPGSTAGPLRPRAQSNPSAQGAMPRETRFKQNLCADHRRLPLHCRHSGREPALLMDAIFNVGFADSISLRRPTAVGRAVPVRSANSLP